MPAIEQSQNTAAKQSHSRPQLRQSWELSTAPNARRAMRAEQGPTASTVGGFSRKSVVVLGERHKLLGHSTPPPFMHEARLQNLPTSFKDIKAAPVTNVDVDLNRAGCDAIIPQDNKTLGAPRYPALIGEEDWYLLCHVNDHRAQNRPRPELSESSDEGDRVKLLRSIPQNFILATLHDILRTIRSLVKEVVIQSLDIQGYKEHVQRRDKLFSELLDEMSDRQLTSVQESCLRFMSSINHGMKICSKGLSK